MNRQTPTVSIVIPVYNEAVRLAACLDAIACQTYAPLEVVIADNNSTDDSAAVARRYPFVRVVQADLQGIVHARNAGFDAARGTLIARIDADVVLPSDWVAEIVHHYMYDAHAVSLMAATGPSVFVGHTRGMLWVAHRLTYFWLGRALFGHTVLFGSNMYLTRELWQRVRGEVCLRTDLHEDLDISAHIHDLGVPLLFAPRLRNAARYRLSAKRQWRYVTMYARTCMRHAPAGEALQSLRRMLARNWS